MLLPTAGRLDVVGDSATTTSHDGKVIVAALDSAGRPLAGFGSLTPSNGASLGVNDALLEPSGRLVVATTGTPGDSYPERIELLGFTADGQLDPSFGSAGSMVLAEPGDAIRLLSAPDGTLLVAGETASTSGATTGLLLARVTPDGHELGATQVSSADSIAGNTSVSAAVELPDGSTMLLGTTPQLFLAHFRPDGTLDSSFGRGGVLRLPIYNVAVDDAAVDPAGGLFVVGAHLGDLGRTPDAPIAAMLLHLRADGSVDPAFAGAGAGSGGGETDLDNVVALPGGEVLASAPDGAVLRFTARGDPDVSFGIAGTSELPDVQLFDATGLLVQGQTALLGGDATEATGYDNRLAVERVLLSGRGIVASQSGAVVQLIPRAGAVGVRVPQAIRAQRLSAAIAAPLVVYSIDLGDGTTQVQVPTHVDARHAAVEVKGAGGSAQIVDGLFSLRPLSGGIAELDLAAPSCARAQTTRIALHGLFSILVSNTTAENRSARAVLSIRQACGHTPQVRVRSGRVTVSRT